MYKIINRINETVFTGEKDGILYTLKRIHPGDNVIYKKLKAIDNENIAKVIELTVIENDFFAVTEFVNGITVRQKLEKDGVFDDREIKKIITAVCSGLEAIHSAGLVHRDITPNNIMLTVDGKVKIIDFGISRFRKENASSDTEILGTHGFAAPEQYGFGQTSDKADIYAVGALINYMKTGALLNEKHAGGRLGKVIDKCTRMDENKRYGSIREVSFAINNKETGRKLIKWLPGFQKGIRYREIIASVYYILSFLFVLILYLAPSTVNGVPTEPTDDLPFCFFMLCMFWVPVLVIGNIADWQGRIKSVASKPIVVRVLISILVTVIVLFICFVFAMLL